MPRFDNSEIAALGEVLRGDSLWPYAFGTIWADPLRGALEQIGTDFAQEGESPRCVVPTSSGTASIHVALGGLGIPAGAEVIVPPITDMGSIMPVIFQNAIPVFADLDPRRGLLTPQTVADAITERTRAVIAVHLSGTPVDIEGIIEVCRAAQARHGHPIRVIEDCAQALGATLNGRPLGSFGDAGCFSLNTWKHLTCGEGGFVVLRDADHRAPCMLFADKHRDRLGQPESSYQGSGLNYRASLIDGAMLSAQLQELDRIAQARNAIGQLADARLAQIEGVTPQPHLAGAFATYFMVMFRLEAVEAERKRDILSHVRGALGEGARLRLGGTYSDLIYRSGVFMRKAFFNADTAPGDAMPLWPAELAAQELERRGQYGASVAYDYRTVCCPGAEDYAANSFCLQLQWNTGESDIEAVTDAFAEAIRAA
ncbi:DegT/DnrJ/EryC1/StrS family aminotransferase [Profundibacterium mesophilum]|uniref:L-glutaminescyllo-inosose aminotransferase n=1 Tax=Profundibacterium mesophilum KAUST100406-0324 TaxID=1037889 RepID=A0A921NVH1_9RHOB|nr:DegT/DnrJ/EryC1/StrS family aminotransferase [Profundibacterium mesophilum]KAF0676255.1 L-glutaminescyllo-inosose aminotransferase [Profundibacterium mesophilum KAUST100406-0324]